MKYPDVYAKKVGNVYRLHDRANDITFNHEYKTRREALRYQPEAHFVLSIKQIDCDCLSYSGQQIFLHELRRTISNED